MFPGTWIFYSGEWKHGLLKRLSVVELKSTVLCFPLIMPMEDYRLMDRLCQVLLE